MDALILKRSHGCYRVARRTIDMPGRQVWRDWVLVVVDPVYGAPSDTHEPKPIFTDKATLKEVEKDLLLQGFNIQGVLKI
jgi:hypothetical protein